MSLNFGQIGPFPSELGALERLKNFPYNGKMVPVSKQACSFLIGSLSNLLVTKTGIKSRMSLNNSRIGSVALELTCLSAPKQFLIYLHECLEDQLASLG